MSEPLWWTMMALIVLGHRCVPVRRLTTMPEPERSALRRHTMELRVDVQLGAAEVDEDLRSLHARLDRSGLLSSARALMGFHFPDLAFHHRQADGEHYIYVEDVARGLLAGYTVFNRLVEVNRRFDRVVRAPHSKYAAPYQRRGIATAVYQWALDQGFCLVSGARQSQGAHALWQSLALRHQLQYIEIQDKAVRFLGPAVDQLQQGSLQTRMILLGAGWEVDGGELVRRQTLPGLRPIAPA